MVHSLRTSSAWILTLLVLLAGSSTALAQEKKVLDHDAYEIWNMLKERAISNDGAWALWRIGPDRGDDTLQVRGLDTGEFFTIPRGARPAFTHDSRHLVYHISPPLDSVRQARLADVPQPQQPKDSLAVRTLSTGDTFNIDRVRSYRLPEEAGGYVAIHLEAPPEDEEEESEDEEAEEEGEAEEEDEAEEREDDLRPGTPLLLRNLETGAEQRFENVSSYGFSENGSILVYTVVSEDGRGDGIFAVSTESGDVTSLLAGHGKYPEFAIGKDGEQVAFLAHLHEDEEREDHAFTLYHWSAGEAEPRLLADETTGAFEDDWHVSENESLNFSEDGSRLYFGTAPPPIPEPDHEDKLDEEIVTVDIWHYDEGLLHTMQLEQVEQERRRTYSAVAHLQDDRIVQLARPDIPQVRVGDEGNADVAVGISNLPYQKEISWDSPRYLDSYLIDVYTGEAELILEGEQSMPSLSPDARYVTWWDRDDYNWYALDTQGGEPVNLTADIQYPLDDQTNDRPMPSGSYGSAGWTEGDAGFIVYDEYDLWLTDPSDPSSPQMLTNEYGRNENIRLRYVDTDRDEPAIDLSEPILLSAFNKETKAAGFYHLQAGQTRIPTRLIYDDYRFSNPTVSENGERFLFTRESFQEFGDLWVSDASFNNMERISDINPQQDEYLWGTVELISWRHERDGTELQGLLYKPENFDPNEEYPMVVYFYERSSDGLHSHSIPYAHRSVIQRSFYTSRGYVVFVPDIIYREGYPGESAMHSIMPAVTQLMEEPWIDEERIAAQGHSWAGYQIAYMVTETDIFRAAAPGAPVANMTSAYGGIRWGSGMSRQFQYERTQSRIGGSLWDYPMRYIDNSPLFRAYKINTPLLIMHNDHDGAVPWEQGIELFTALRRLGKPAWLVNYNDEPHWPTTYANRVDWQIRLSQFLDHYLKDEPAPRWLEEGIPAIEKGVTLGYEVLEPEEEPVTEP